MEFSQDLANALVRSVETFPVDFDDAWRWIGYSEKRAALRMLKNNFDASFDFLDKGTKSSDGGRPSEWIVLTVDCFKSFCMMAGTQRGKEVRRYFLNCERQLKEESRLIDQRISNLEQAIADLKAHPQKKLPAKPKKQFPPSTDAIDRILKAIAVQPSSDSHQIAALAGMSESYVRRTLAYMDVKGMVSRERNTQQDNWRFIYSLPPAKERPALPPNLAAQLSNGNPQLFWIFKQCQIYLNSGVLIVNFPSVSLEKAFETEEFLELLFYNADAIGATHYIQQVKGEMSFQVGVQLAIEIDRRRKGE